MPTPLEHEEPSDRAENKKRGAVSGEDGTNSNKRARTRTTASGAEQATIETTTEDVHAESSEGEEQRTEHPKPPESAKPAAPVKKSTYNPEKSKRAQIRRKARLTQLIANAELQSSRTKQLTQRNKMLKEQVRILYEENQLLRKLGDELPPEQRDAVEGGDAPSSPARVVATVAASPTLRGSVHPQSSEAARTLAYLQRETDPHHSAAAPSSEAPTSIPLGADSSAPSSRPSTQERVQELERIILQLQQNRAESRAPASAALLLGPDSSRSSGHQNYHLIRHPDAMSDAERALARLPPSYLHGERIVAVPSIVPPPPVDSSRTTRLSEETLRDLENVISRLPPDQQASLLVSAIRRSPTAAAPPPPPSTNIVAVDSLLGRVRETGERLRAATAAVATSSSSHSPSLVSASRSGAVRRSSSPSSRHHHHSSSSSSSRAPAASAEDARRQQDLLLALLGSSTTSSSGSAPARSGSSGRPGK